MSLEDQLKKNTEALEKNIAVTERLIEHLTSGSPDKLTKAVGEKVADNKTNSKKEDTKDEKKAPAKKSAAKKTDAKAEKLSEEEVLKHPDFQAIVKLFGEVKDLIDEKALDDEDVVKLLDKYKVKTARALQKDQWDDFANDLQELIDGARATEQEEAPASSSFV